MFATKRSKPQTESQTMSKKKAAGKKAKQNRRPKQRELPGVESITIVEVDEALDEWINRKDDFKTAKEKFEAADKDLRGKVHKNGDVISKSPDGTLVYRRGEDLLELLPTKEKLKIRKAPAEKGNAPEDTTEGTT